MLKKSLFAIALSALATLMTPVGLFAQAMESSQPFKVGTFAINDIPTVGLVLDDDQVIVDLTAANRAMELLHATAP